MSTSPETPRPGVWSRLGRRPGVALATAAAGLAFVVAAVVGPQGGRHVLTTPVKRGDVRITIVESGELRAVHQATVSASTDKQITWLVPEGTQVKKGDLVVRFESEKYEIAIQTAKSALKVTRAELKMALGQLEGQHAAEERARLEYEALPELAEKGFVNRNELDAARLAYQEVKANTGTHRAAVEAAQANVERAAREVEQQDRKLREGLVRAPRDGVVVYATMGDVANPRKITLGMTPFEGMELMYLPDTTSMRVDTEISEFDLAKVRVGSPVELRLVAYPGMTFRGEVSSIASLARQKISKVSGRPIGAKVFDVSIKVIDQDGRLKPGLSATVEIVVSENPDVLYVPIAGVFVDELEQTVVYASDGNGPRKQPVDLGGSTNRVAIVLAGVEEGQEILLDPPQIQ